MFTTGATNLSLKNPLDDIVRYRIHSVTLFTTGSTLSSSPPWALFWPVELLCRHPPPGQESYQAADMFGLVYKSLLNLRTKWSLKSIKT